MGSVGYPFAWGYFLPEHGETADDVREVYEERWRYVGTEYRPVKVLEFDDHEDAAEAAAKLHYARSSPDWNIGEEKIAIVDTNGTVKTFDVLLEYEPTFSVSEARQAYRREATSEAQCVAR